MEWGLYFTVVGLGMMGWDDRLWIVVGKAYVGGWLEVVRSGMNTEEKQVGQNNDVLSF